MKKTGFLLFVIVLFSMGSAYATSMDLTLTNTGIDTDAAGTLYWESLAPSFTGVLNISNLDTLSFTDTSGWGANGYQIKLEQNWRYCQMLCMG